MDPAKVLREQERLLALEYGASRPPSSLGGEDLDCDDPRDARHWVGVYTELVEFVHDLTKSQSSERLGDPEVRAMTLQARVLELHLAFWTERLRWLGKGDDPSDGEVEGEQSP